MNILVFLIALISIPITSAFLGFLLIFVLGSIERKVLFNKKIHKYELIIIFILNSTNTFITKTFSFFIAKLIFNYFLFDLSFIFIIICGILFIIHDYTRIKKFTTSFDIWKEAGYLFGDVLAVIFAILFLIN